jgi:high-affinity iron transporter
MLAGFLLTLRESLEAALIIGVLLGTLKKLNGEEYQKSIWYGTGLAILLSGIIGYLIHLLGASFEGRAEEIFEGITMLLAAGILTWVLLWMREKAKNFNQQLDSDVRKALGLNSAWALFSLAFLAVIREGIELAIFLTAAAVDNKAGGVVTGAVLGFGAAIILAILLFTSLIRLNLSRFFQVTSLILLLFAAGLVAHGVHEFNEVGLIPSVIEHLWDINHLLDEKSAIGLTLKSLFGYNGNPSLTEVIAYILYLVGIGTYELTRGRTRKEF